MEALHKQHRTGNVYEVHINMLVPGAELAVSKQPQKVREKCQNPDVYNSVREAFRAAERQLIDFKRQLNENVVPHQPLFQGQVAEMHPEEDYGYLLTAEGALPLAVAFAEGPLRRLRLGGNPIARRSRHRVRDILRVIQAGSRRATLPRTV